MMTIRPWKKSDLDAIERIEAFCFADPWTRDNLADVLKYPHYRSFLVEDGGQVCGYGCITVMFEHAEIANIAVAAPYRGRGIGKFLLHTMHTTAKALGAEECFLEVRKSNANAIALYEKSGYERYGVRARYYGNEDAILMKKKL